MILIKLSRMAESPLKFEIEVRDQTTQARLGRVSTLHGSFDTPAFMNVGTQATVKGLLPEQVESLGAQIILGNTYHLMLRPGSELIDQMGGLHKWMRWDKPILTDSGGFQVFSLADINRMTEDGVVFRNHLNGSLIDMTPERSMQVQNHLGSDIMMAFDDCPPAKNVNEHARQRSAQFKNVGGGNKAKPTRGDVNKLRSKGEAQRQEEQQGGDKSKRWSKGGVDPALGAGMDDAAYIQRVKEANERTIRWLERCKKAHARKSEQALFGICQGGTDYEQREWCAKRVSELDLPGYAIGGVAVGEGPEEIKKVVQFTAPLLPEEKPRYLMGVGYERDILLAVQAGVDMFDCVLPTRNGRNANAFTSTGQIRLKNAKFATDPNPIEDGCDCPACSGGFSRSYLRHLFRADEMLGGILVSAHNIRHFQRFMLDIRAAIRQNDWSLIRTKWPVAFAE
ncbi:Queuine tRNA-ribosyltransferase [Poriferisphaera corsica]|uniref:Queuine tRNA-ribosyltransferase n=1 Tax=Poriferisphaera corsica TaxID=2528020 RepID=A0A517YX13_9BACT|nr:tRNA guanosine(34) transglycosylase Tgt [Poriferisphaera corsica]QDU34765.1 Queuine tRNA-ribosyltransferase [Poriferisphaera corsica]